MYEKIWQSYPVERPRVSFEGLVLDEEEVGGEKPGKVFYTAGMEGFISTMETSSLMGKNVGRLIVDGWMKKEGEGNKEGQGVEEKEELQEL